MNTVQAYYEKLIKICHDFLVGIRQHKIAFVISILLGSLPFIYAYNVKKDLYESSFTVSYEELVRKIYGDRLRKINILIHQQNIDKVSTLLQIDKKVAKTLVSVDGKNILGEDLSKDMNTDKIPFIVKIAVNDSTYLRELQTGIMNFLEYGNNYMAEKNKIRLREITDEIEFIDNQLRVMDSIKRMTKIDRYAMPGGNNAKTPEANISASLFQFSYELYKKRQELYRKRELESSLQVVDDAIVSKSIKASFLLYVVYSIAASLVIYLIIIGFILPIINYKE